MKFLKPWRRSLNQSSLLPNENCALIFCLFEEAGCSLRRSSEEHGGVASRALVVIPNWNKHQNHKSSGMEIGVDLPLPKWVTLRNTVIPFWLSFFQPDTQNLHVCYSLLFHWKPILHIFIFHSVMEYLRSQYHTSTSKSHNISFAAFLAHPFHDLTCLAENAQRSWCLPNHVYMRCFLSPFLPCFGRP